MKKNTFISVIFTAVLCCLFPMLSAQTTIGPFTFYPTNAGGTMQGQAHINGVAAGEGDIIAAFDPDDVCAGAALLTIYQGTAYINFVIYGDDGGGFGMNPGEDFYLKLYDASEDATIEYGQPLSGWANTNFAPMPGYNDPQVVYNFVSFTPDPPTVYTKQVSAITATSATCGGVIIGDGGAPVTARGVCWNTTGNPTLADNHTVDGTGIGSYNSYLTGLTCNTTYYVNAYATNSVGTDYGTQKVFTTLACPPDPDWELVWTIPYNPMNFFVYKATIEGVDMVAGDWIGLFDIDPNTGEEICVGKEELTESLVSGVFLEILASMDDGTNPDAANGFTPGHEIIYKLWSPATGDVTHVDATYPYPGFDEVYAALGTTLVELDGVLTIPQTFDLDLNWNLISFMGTPENPDMLSIVDPLIIQETLFKVLDQDGNVVIHLPTPPPNGQWYNSIGDLTITQGYYIKVTEATSFTLNVAPVSFPFEVPLRASWSMMAYPCEGQQDAMGIVQPLIDNTQLVKVIDDQGNTIVHVPFPEPNGQWVNTIGNFMPDEGYYINVNTETTLSIPEGTDYIPPAKTLICETGSYFDPAYEGNPFMPMHLIFEPDALLEAGDEVAVFDGEVCVGSVMVNNGDPVVVTAASDDPDTEIQDGFVAGHPVKIKIRKASTGQVVGDVPFTVLEGAEYFSPLETLAGQLDMLFTGIHPRETAGGFSVHPNPFSESTVISFYLPEQTTIAIHLYDVTGVEVKTITEREFNAGNHQITVNRSDIENGCYLLRATIGNGDQVRQEIRKLIIH